jgi:hypothetical protein
LAYGIGVWGRWPQWVEGKSLAWLFSSLLERVRR